MSLSCVVNVIWSFRRDVDWMPNGSSNIYRKKKETSARPPPLRPIELQLSEFLTSPYWMSAAKRIQSKIPLPGISVHTPCLFNHRSSLSTSCHLETRHDDSKIVETGRLFFNTSKLLFTVALKKKKRECTVHNALEKE